MANVKPLFQIAQNKSQYISTVTVPDEEATANYVPAAAVIRRVQALIGITGRKAHVGGLVSQG